MDSGADAPGPDLAQIEALAGQALRGLPQAVQDIAAEVAIRCLDWPPADMLVALGITDPTDLTGLYEGTPLTQKSVLDVPQAPDVIYLFVQPILAEWRERPDLALADLVTHVLVHELAHHFGWSDADIAAIDRWWT